MHPWQGTPEKKTAPERVRQGPVEGNGNGMSHHALGCAVVVICDAVFVFHHLTV